MVKIMKKENILFFLIFLLNFCGGEIPQPLHQIKECKGVKVVFDLEAKPLPEIPLPNDIATRIDPSSPTGKRLNVSLIAPTFLEEDTRAKINNLDGWGIYSPISVKFSGLIDLQNIIEKHQKNVDFNDDAVYLINIDKKSEDFGKPSLLDMGRGNFPLILDKLNNYFENDPRGSENNIIFETIEEDINKNGVLDTGEDSDGDGVLDHPNILKPDGNINDDLLTFYEKETNTLIIRPVLPLHQQTTYAVVLTKRLIDEKGNSVCSPFSGVNHSDQTEDLMPLKDILPQFGLNLDDIAFSWSFTTQSVTRDIETIRAGLYGSGSMKYLKDEYPYESFVLKPLRDFDVKNPFLAPMEDFSNAFGPYLDTIAGVDPEQKEVLIEDFKNIDYLIAGHFLSPYFLIDRDGISTKNYPADDDEIFEIDPLTGKATYAPQAVTFWCAIPKEKDFQKKPFAVQLYGHGYTSNLFEMLGFSGRMAKFAIASCGIDAVGHGIVIPEEMNGMNLKELLFSIFDSVKMRNLLFALENGRSRDLNNDGVRDSGGDFWTADIFHTRDAVRQTIVDYIQFIRLLRGFNGKRTWSFDTDGDGKGNLAGDFDGDGFVDIGGESVSYHVWGQSLGGIISAIVAGIEPAISSAAPVAGGAGLVDIGIRSTQGGVAEAVIMPILGPFITGEPKGYEGVELKFLLNDVNDDTRRVFFLSKEILPGDIVVAHNLRNNEKGMAIVPASVKFRLSVPADALSATEKRVVLGINENATNTPVEIKDPFLFGDPLEIIVYDGASGLVKEVINRFGFDVLWQGALYRKGSPLAVLQKGFGLIRNTPDFRRLFTIASFVLEPGDPVGYAPHYYKYPLKYDYDPDVKPTTNVLVIPTAGDMNVPVNTGIAIARAAGVIELFKKDQKWGKTQNDLLIDNYVLEAVERLKRFGDKEILFDVDNLSEGLDEFSPPRLSPPLRATIKTDDGFLAMRIPYLNPKGKHGFDISQPSKKFDINNYMNNLVAYWFFSRGNPEKIDDLCYEDTSCPFFPFNK